MVYFFKGYTHIHNTIVQLNVHVGANIDIDNAEYGYMKEVEYVANEAIKESNILKDNFGIDQRYFRGLRVEYDDSYYGDLTDAYGKTKTEWNYYKIIDARRVTIEREDMSYKVSVTLVRGWFSDEEHTNMK